MKNKTAKSAEQRLDETMKQEGIRMGWIPEVKQAVIKAVENHLQDQWLSVENPPNDEALYLVSWKLTEANRGYSCGVFVGYYDLERKNWFRVVNSSMLHTPVIHIKGATAWMPFPNPPEN